MKDDNSRNNYNYQGLPIDEIIDKPDEYIVPECLEACKKFWDMNIFTASCSNRKEKKDENGNIKKYIMVSHLSEENIKIFDNLIKNNKNNYFKQVINNVMYYYIIITSKDTIEERDQDSQKLLELTLPFKIQDCMEGFKTIKEYYKEKIIDNKTITESDFEITERVKKHLLAKNQIDLLDLDRGIVYNKKFYRDIHQRYLEMQQKNKENKSEEFILE